mgnify:CR=1 FL=1
MVSGNKNYFFFLGAAVSSTLGAGAGLAGGELVSRKSEMPKSTKRTPIMTINQNKPPLKKVPAAFQKFHAPQVCE